MVHFCLKRVNLKDVSGLSFMLLALILCSDDFGDDELWVRKWNRDMFMMFSAIYGLEYISFTSEKY